MRGHWLFPAPIMRLICIAAENEIMESRRLIDADVIFYRDPLALPMSDGIVLRANVFRPVDGAQRRCLCR
jgi:hypothetical protein